MSLECQSFLITIFSVLLQILITYFFYFQIKRMEWKRDFDYLSFLLNEIIEKKYEWEETLEYLNEFFKWIFKIKYNYKFKEDFKGIDFEKISDLEKEKINGILDNLAWNNYPKKYRKKRIERLKNKIWEK